MKNFKRLAVAGLVMASSCQVQPEPSTEKYGYYDTKVFGGLLVNKIDRGYINVYLVSDEDRLKQDIGDAIAKWTSVPPIPYAEAYFVDDLSLADLIVEVVGRNEGKPQVTTLFGNNRPVITLFENHNRTTLLHEMGHAFGLMDTYFTYHDPVSGALQATCDTFLDQPKSLMCLSQNGEYKLYEDDKEGIVQLYRNRINQ